MIPACTQIILIPDKPGKPGIWITVSFYTLHLGERSSELSLAQESLGGGATCNPPPSNDWQYPGLEYGQVRKARRAAARQSGHFNFGLIMRLPNAISRYFRCADISRGRVPQNGIIPQRAAILHFNTSGKSISQDRLVGVFNLRSGRQAACQPRNNHAGIFHATL